MISYVLIEKNRSLATKQNLIWKDILSLPRKMRYERTLARKNKIQTRGKLVFF